jgi:hypothetical protein
MKRLGLLLFLAALALPACRKAADEPAATSGSKTEASDTVAEAQLPRLVYYTIADG